MKLSNAIILLVFAIMTVAAHAQVTEDSGLPSGGENSPPPPSIQDAPPVENAKEFNQDIDDFEKKISKEVPPAAGKGGAKAPAFGAQPGAAPTGEPSVKGAMDSTKKAREAMKKAHDENSAADAGGGNGIAARKAAKKNGTASAKKGKTTGADKKGKKSSKKTAGKKSGGKKSPPKKKKKSADE
ncbi:MAG: hypothetical protein ACXVA9_01835 [Bdellovibrionales bacterium]